MTTSRRISIIGAGSGEFSMGIVRDLCLTPSLWGSTVSLRDSGLCRRLLGTSLIESTNG